jgi:uncharacterized membrane protein YoaK (UPF0700 family)
MGSACAVTSKLKQRSGPAGVALMTLAFAAGATDATTYLALGRVFTANMTGNTVLLGIALVGGDGARVARSLCALGGFCAGVAGATLALAQLLRRGRSTGASAALLGELALLIAVAIAGVAAGRGGDSVFWLIALSGMAMGAQSAVVREAGPPGVATTYISGTLTGLLASATRRLARERSDESDSPATGTLWLPAAVWLTYLGAALAGAAATDRWGLGAAWIACGAVGAVLVWLRAP